jgi:signal transduction histidine kinase
LILTAKLLDHRGWSVVTTRHESLVLQSDGHVFQARWESELPGPWDLQADSYVQITGVNDAETGSFKSRPTFQLLLRSPDDVVLAATPPFWFRSEMRKPLLTAGGVGVIALAWILMQRFHLRRLEARVADRTTDLRDANDRLRHEVLARETAEKETRVALEVERELNQLKSSFVSMVSHEFRTPLEVILSSSHILDRYLDRLPNETRREQLKAIRVVQRSQ